MPIVEAEDGTPQGDGALSELLAASEHAGSTAATPVPEHAAA